MKFKIDILGTKYTVKYEDGRKDKYLRDNSNVTGYTNRIDKVIGIREHKDFNYLEEVIFHELAHAYLNESGITNYGGQEVKLHSELTCDWISINIMKIVKSHSTIFKKIYQYENKKLKKKVEKNNDKKSI